MSSSPSTFAHIYQKNKEITTRKTIPPNDLSNFEKRLVITCTVSPTRKPGPKKSKRSTNKEYLAVSRARKIAAIYYEILEKSPDIFLAFILTVSPKACRQYKVGEFLQQHTQQPISLSEDANSLLWKIAIKRGIENTAPFKKLISSLFGKPSPPTDAEGERKWSLVLSDLHAVRTCLGETVCDAIRRSPTYNPKQVGGHHLETSECVKTSIPRDAEEDVIVYIDVGSALEIADILFPAASERIASAVPKFPPIVFEPDIPETASSPERQISSCEIDFAHFILRGASVCAIGSLFGQTICEAIDESDLRSWEKNHLVLEATDCITMQISRVKPEHGRIRLRIGFWSGVNLVNKLYATSS